ncbi:palmitoyltransferase ZDHHC1 [Rhinophrynus dorsalis]
MSICKNQSSKTVPEEKGSIDPPQHSRKNGWSWPPNPLQIVAWSTYLLFTIVGFGVLVPLLPRHWVAAGYVCMGAMFAYHCVVHFLAVTIDPADDKVQAKSSSGPLPVFDRTKHAHVIENLYCYICEVDVGPKTKHCSSCNKCVSRFDHHCKWLNNCVGGKNYWLFFNCLISAFLGALLLSTISSYVFVAYFIDPTMLRTDKHFEVLRNLSDVWFVFLPAAPVETRAPAILTLAALITVMGLLTLLLIGHLLCFHVYLLWNKLSTYDYIINQRLNEVMKSSSREPEEGDSSPAGQVPVQEEMYGGSLIYTNPDVQIVDPSQGSLKRDCPVLPYNDDGDPESDPRPSLSVEKKPRKKKRKKRKKTNQVLPGAINHLGDEPGHRVLLQPPCPEIPVSPAHSSLVVPSPVFPSISEPVLAPISNHPIQAAGPPAEYHSDSAESMEEIPVAQTHLGSTSMSENMVFSQRSSKDLVSKCEHGQSQSHFQPVTLHQKFELLPKVPSVFVSDSSGEPLPNILFVEPKAQNSQCIQHNKMWVARGKEGEQVLSICNQEFLTSISSDSVS